MQIRTQLAGYTGTIAGVAFRDGVGHTDDPAALAYFRRHAYIIEPDDEPDEGDEFDPTVGRTAEELSKLTIAQLRAYAGAHELDLAGATRKPDILAAVVAGALGTEPDPAE